MQVSIIAKDYGMTAVSFNHLLHELGIQFKLGSTWLLYQELAGKGYTCSRTYHINEERSIMHTYWTQAGRLFLYKTLKENGLIPLIEDLDAAGL
nr:phage antirepressor KilAC domain-containing protein [Sedimentibacter sp.]